MGTWSFAALVALGYLTQGVRGVVQNRDGDSRSLQASKAETARAGIALGCLFAVIVTEKILVVLLT